MTNSPQEERRAEGRLNGLVDLSLWAIAISLLYFKEKNETKGWKKKSKKSKRKEGTKSEERE